MATINQINNRLITPTIVDGVVGASLQYKDTSNVLSGIALSAQSGKFIRVNAAGTGLEFASSNGITSDPIIINNVAYFNRTTKPVQRDTGVPLVIGDRWYNPSTGVEAYWNGTYWVSSVLYYCSRYRLVTNLSFVAFPNNSDIDTLNIKGNTWLFLETIEYQCDILSNGDENNYKCISISARGRNGNAPPVWTSQTKLFTSGIVSKSETVGIALNSLFTENPLSYSRVGFTFFFLNVGNAPNVSYPYVSLSYRIIYI